MDKRTDGQAAPDPIEEGVERFRESLGPFVVAAEAAPMSMVFTDAQAGHPVVFANNSFLALTGARREEILGKDIAALLGAFTDARTLSRIERTLNDGAQGSWEARCRHLRGDEFLARILLRPVTDRQGRVTQHFVSVEPHGGVDRLLKGRHELSLHEQSPVFIATAEGADHQFTFANAAYKRLIGREDIVGRTVAEVLPEVRDQGFIDLLDQVFQSGQPFVGTSMPIWFAPDAGEVTTRYVSFVYQPIRSQQGDVTGVFCEGYDVTAERQAADKVAVLQTEVAHLSRVNAMSMMASTIAHELNQPLTAIRNYAVGGLRLLDRNPAQADAVAEAFRAIEEAAQRAGDIIGNVRTLMRRGETPRGSFKLKAAAEECIRLVTVGSSAIHPIDNRISDTLCIVADRVQIQQVIINLLRNALDATGGSADPGIVIDAADNGTQLVVSISDAGPGLAPAAAENIFEWTDSSKEGGMGLGLSISRTIVEGHGGRIWLERSDRCGSEFRFSIPKGVSGPVGARRD